MVRRRFSADQLNQKAAQARINDRAEPPQEEASLTDVVRAMWPNIQGRRAAKHSFTRIAEWLAGQGYPIDAATLRTYHHRILKERQPVAPDRATPGAGAAARLAALDGTADPLLQFPQSNEPASPPPTIAPPREPAAPQPSPTTNRSGRPGPRRTA